MNIEFKFGPKDGNRRFLPMGKMSDTIIVECGGNDHLYRKTKRTTDEGYTLYQYIGTIKDMAEVA